MMWAFGSFRPFCDNAPLPVCALFAEYGDALCTPRGIGGRVGDLGTILLDVVAILWTVWAVVIAQSREAAVAKRECQVLLAFYGFVSLLDIFVTGRFLSNGNAKAVMAAGGMAAVEVAALTALFWLLALFGITYLGIMDDGTVTSLWLYVGSALLLFGGTLYVALDTFFGFTATFWYYYDIHNIALYVMHLGVIAVSAVVYAVVVTVVIVRLREKRPLVYHFLSVFSFIGGQVFEFVGSVPICRHTRRSIDGAFFQTLFSLVAMVFVYVTWHSITEDSWQSGWTGDNGVETLTRTNGKQEYGVTTTGTYSAPLKIHKLPGASTRKTLADLEPYKTQFLDLVEREVGSLIRSTGRWECTAIDEVRGNSRTTITFQDPIDWSKRFVRLLKHKGMSGTPDYKGAQLDSHLTAPIMQRVEQLYTQFLSEHGDLIGANMIDRLNGNPAVQRAFARHLGAALRESSEPVTEEIYKAVVHLVQHQVSDEAANQLGQHMAHAAMHAGAPAVTAFTAQLGHMLAGLVAKTVAKHASVAAIKKIAVKKLAVIGAHAAVPALISLVGANAGAAAAGKAGAGGLGVAASIAAWPVVVVIVGVLVGWELHRLPREMAEKVAPEVRRVLAGEWDEWNKSALDKIFEELFADGGKQLAKIVLEESEMGELAKEAGTEMWEAAKERGGQLMKEIRAESLG